MPEAELKGIISGDASDFVAAGKVAQNALGDLGKAGKKANNQLKDTLGGSGKKSVFGGLVTTLGKVKEEAKKAGASIAVGFRAAVKVLKTVAVAGTALVTVLGGIGVASVSSFAKFQQSFSQVRTLVDESKVNVSELAQGVRDLSVAFGVDAVEATNAAYQAISAGQDPARVVDFLKVAFEGAAAGAASAVDTVNLFTSALNTFKDQGLDAATASDVLFTTVRLGKTTITELAGSFGQVGPIAAAAGVSFADLGAALATTTAQGLSTAEASTAIKASIAGIVNPAGAAASALASIGVSARSLREEGLVETFQKIGEATGGSVDQIVKFLPNIRAVNAAAILAGSGLSSFVSNAVESANAAGAAGAAFGKTREDISLLFKQIQQTLTDTFREIGKAITPLVQSLAKVFRSFALETRSEVRALASVLSDRFAQATTSIDEFGNAVEDSGGAVTLGLRAVSEALRTVADGFDVIAEPVAGIAAGFRFLGDVVQTILLTSLAALTNAFNTLLQVVTFVPATVLEAAAALADFAGLDIAEDLGGAADSLNELRDQASAFTESLAESRNEAIETTASLSNLTETFDKTKSAIKETSVSFREAAKDVDEFGVEVQKANQKIQDEDALAEQKRKLDEIKPAADAAAGSLAELGDAAAGAAPGVEKATSAATGLGDVLARVAGDSAAAAQGLKDLGPTAEKIAQQIAAIGSARSEGKAIEDRQAAVRALVEKADADTREFIARQNAQGKKAIADAKALLDAAKAAAREAAGTEDFTEAFAAQERAQANLEETTRRVSDSFLAERKAAEELRDAALQSIQELEGGLDALRERDIQKAEGASTQRIAILRKEAQEQLAIVAEQFNSGQLSLGELNFAKFAISDTLDLDITAERERLEGDLTRVGEKFSELENSIRDTEIEAAFRDAFPSESDAIGKLADQLKGEFGDAVKQAREDAKAFELSQDELDQALLKITQDAAAAGDKIAAQGLAARMTAEDVKVGTEAFEGMSESVQELGKRLDEDGKAKLEELTQQLEDGEVSLEGYSEGLLGLAEDAKLTGRELRALVADIQAQADAAEAAASRAAAARNSFSRTGVGQRSGGETQAQVNARFGGGFGLGIQSSRPRTVQSVFQGLSASQRNQVREQARQAGVTNDQEFTRFVVENSPGLDPGGLSFDLGGPVRVDQLAKLQQGERVLTRSQNAALGQLFQGFTGRISSAQTVNVSPTFNIEGGNAESFRQTARDLLPEITRATKLGVTGKGLL